MLTAPQPSKTMFQTVLEYSLTWHHIKLSHVGQQNMCDNQALTVDSGADSSPCTGPQLAALLVFWLSFVTLS